MAASTKYYYYFGLLLLLALVGCHSSHVEGGHWGDRSDWRSNNWTQVYYADSDAHSVGWIENRNSMSVLATCEDDPKAMYSWDQRHTLGSFETQEDAQMAVEKNCSVVKGKK